MHHTMVCFRRARTWCKSGACNRWSIDCCLKVAMYFYDGKSEKMNSSSSTSSTSTTSITNEKSKGKGKSLGIPMHPVSDIEIAELVRLLKMHTDIYKLHLLKISIFTVRLIT